LGFFQLSKVLGVYRNSVSGARKKKKQEARVKRSMTRMHIVTAGLFNFQKFWEYSGFQKAVLAKKGSRKQA
jgi:hypothetical protein